MVDDTHASKAMKFIVPHRTWLLQHDDDDDDHNSNRRWGFSSTGGGDVGKYLIYEGDYHNAQQIETTDSHCLSFPYMIFWVALELTRCIKMAFMCLVSRKWSIPITVFLLPFEKSIWTCWNRHHCHHQQQQHHYHQPRTSHWWPWTLEWE